MRVLESYSEMQSSEATLSKSTSGTPFKMAERDAECDHYTVTNPSLSGEGLQKALVITNTRQKSHILTHNTNVAKTHSQCISLTCHTLFANLHI